MSERNRVPEGWTFKQKLTATVIATGLAVAGLAVARCGSDTHHDTAATAPVAPELDPAVLCEERPVGETFQYDTRVDGVDLETLLAVDSPDRQEKLRLYAREAVGAFLNGIDDRTLPPDVTISVGAEAAYASDDQQGTAEADARLLATDYAKAIGSLPDAATMVAGAVPVNPQGITTFPDAGNDPSVTLHAYANRTCLPTGS